MLLLSWSPHVFFYNLDLIVQVLLKIHLVKQRLSNLNDSYHTLETEAWNSISIPALIIVTKSEFWNQHTNSPTQFYPKAATVISATFLTITANDPSGIYVA